MKKLLLLLLLLIPFTVKAISGYSSFLEEWDLTDGVLTIEAQPNRDSTVYEGGTWRPYASEIKKIVLIGFDHINTKSFQNLPELEEVELPKTMAAQISDYAFYNCPKLKNITIPEGLIRIGHNAFGNTGITEVEIPVYTAWVEDDAFPEGTIINRPAEYDELIAAGTAGKYKQFSAYMGSNGEGRASNNTCYNRFIGGISYYDDTAFWKLYKDGTMIIWGNDLAYGYTSSRAPWGCYKKQIKKVIYNAEKTGAITKQDQLNNDKKLSNAVYAIYSNKPVEEIMNNRIRSVEGQQFWDCREDCLQSTFNIDTIIFNRGVEYLGRTMTSDRAGNVDRQVYINKYLKTIEDNQIYLTEWANPKATIVHLEVSAEDYINNGYNYNILSSTYFSGHDNIIENGAFITDLGITTNSFKGELLNDIDEYYVSINDNLAPKEIEVDGVTLYLYETYRTNAEGKAKIGLPDMIEGLDFYVKEIQPSEGYELDPVAYKIDMSKKNIDLTVQDLSIEDALALSQLVTNPEEQQENPLTKDNVMVLLVLFGLSIILIIYNYRKGHELL